MTHCLSIFVLIVFICLASQKSAWSATADGGNAIAQTGVSSVYGKLPLRFEVNNGQTDEQVRFISRGSGYSMFLTPTEAVMVLTSQGAVDKETAKDKPAATSTLRMALINANPDPKVTGEDILPGKSNYFTGNDSKNWRTNISSYGKVRYEEVYPGIDLIYYGNQSKLEYDFIVKPGADPKNIRMTFDGVDKLSIDEQGNLVVQMEGGDVIQQAPIIYQKENQASVTGRYIVLTDNQVGFEVDSYDPDKTLVIDPVLVYSTYLGGSKHDFGNAIAVDSSGNAYITGNSSSSNFPTKSGASYQAVYGGAPYNEVFVSKLNPTGTALIYSTYLGGNSNDQGNSIAVDSSGNAYITGYTNSSNFPTMAGAYQTTHRGPSEFMNAFVTKLNPTDTMSFIRHQTNAFIIGLNLKTKPLAYKVRMFISLRLPVFYLLLVFICETLIISV